MELSRASDRRIGNRKNMEPIRIDWRVPDPSKKRRRRAAAESGWIVDISVTGAAIEAPRANDLFLGQRVRIGLGGHTGVVVIRRAVPSTVDRMARYGVEYVDLEPELAEQLRMLLEEDRPAGLEERWQRAR